MILLVIALALMEVWRQWYIIERKKIDLAKNDTLRKYPNHITTTAERVVVVLVGTIWLSWPFFVLCFTLGWWIFQYGLNAARRKDTDHLGNTVIDKTFSRIDAKIGATLRIILHTFIAGLGVWVSF